MIEAHGEVEWTLRDLGIEPPSVAGVVKVANGFRMTFDIRARPEGARDPAAVGHPLLDGDRARVTAFGLQGAAMLLPGVVAVVLLAAPPGPASRRSRSASCRSSA